MDLLVLRRPSVCLCVCFQRTSKKRAKVQIWHALFQRDWKYLQIADKLMQLTPLLNEHDYFLLLMHGRESSIFGSIFVNWDFDGLTYFEGPWVCLCVCFQRSSRKKKAKEQIWHTFFQRDMKIPLNSGHTYTAHTST